METIAFILFVALVLLVMLIGSVVVAMLFRKFGDGWKFRKGHNE